MGVQQIKFGEFAARCRYRVGAASDERRPANALCIEHFTMAPWRCTEQRPEHWPEGSSSIRWLASGGEATVFGACGRSGCPLLRAVEEEEET